MNRLSRRSIIHALASFSISVFLLPSRAKAEASQPHMQAAFDALGIARRELAVAEEDKDNHRARAIKLVNQAINQVELGIKCGPRN